MCRCNDDAALQQPAQVASHPQWQRPSRAATVRTSLRSSVVGAKVGRPWIHPAPSTSA